MIDTNKSQVRLFWILSGLAILHAVLLLLTLIVFEPVVPWRARLWVGVMTLWFFWPLIISLHSAGSVRRVYVSIAICSVVIALPLQTYLTFLGPAVFLPGELISFSPYELGPYALSYAGGWIEARKRAGKDPIILEGYGMTGQGTPGAPPFSSHALMKYKIEIKPVALCAVGPRIQGHASGYNRASVAEIKHRYGAEVISRAEQEEAQRQDRYQTALDVGRSDAANDLRSDRLAIEVFLPWRDDGVDYETLLREKYKIELRQVVRELQPDVDYAVTGHAQGYNETSTAEIRRRFGNEAWKSVSAAQSRYSRVSLGPR